MTQPPAVSRKRIDYLHGNEGRQSRTLPYRTQSDSSKVTPSKIPSGRVVSLFPSKNLRSSDRNEYDGDTKVFVMWQHVPTFRSTIFCRVSRVRHIVSSRSLCTPYTAVVYKRNRAIGFQADYEVSTEYTWKLRVVLKVNKNAE